MKIKCKLWKDNKEVFGCNDKNLKLELGFLCDNPKITAGSNYLNFIFVFRGGKYWKFDNKPKPNKPFGELVDGGIPAKNKWPGIHFPGGAGAEKSNFIMIYESKWSRWKHNQNNKPVGDNYIEDDSNDDSDGVKPSQENKQNVDEENPTDGNFGDDSTDSIPSSGNSKGTKPNKKGNQQTDDEDSEHPKPEDIGDDSGDDSSGGTKPNKNGGKGNNPNTGGKEPNKNESDEDNPTDGDSGGTETEESEILSPKPTRKPTGSGATQGKLDESDINDINDEPIREEELPDEPAGDDSDAGALIDDEDNVGAKIQIKGNKVCNFIIKKNKMYSNGKCVSIEEDKHKYSPDIIAALKAKDKNWYFVNKEGQYCKRKDKVNDKVF